MARNDHTLDDLIEMDSVAKRLRWAIYEHQEPRGRRRGLRLFQARLQERQSQVPELAGEGTSLRAIQGYVNLNDPVIPSLRFLEEAATLLGLRPEWLAFGSGLPTPVDEDEVTGNPLALSEEMVREGSRIMAGYRRAVWRELENRVLGWWGLPDAARGRAIRTFEAYRRLPSVLAEYGERTPADAYPVLAERYGAYLASPYDTLRLDADRLGPTEQALIMDALLRPIEIAGWASRPTEEEDTDQ